MKVFTKVMMIACIALLAACAVPPNETDAQRTDRINRGVATGATLYVIAGITALVIAAAMVENLADGGGEWG